MRGEAQDVLYRPTNIGTFQHFSQAWLTCMGNILTNGHEALDGEARLKEMLNVSMSAYSCSIGDFLNCGASDERLQLMLVKYRSQSVLPQYKVSYGRLFRNHNGINQIKWLIDRLRDNPHSKSATIGFHVPGDQELSCISLLDCKVRGGALHVTAVYRSQNVYASQPGNVCALHEIQQEIADKLRISTGVLALHIMSAHIYENDWSAAHGLVARNGGLAAGQASGGCLGSRK
jgi:thymidylate synthase